MKILLGIIFLILFVGQVSSQTQEVSFTLDDRDRIIKLEEKINSLDNKIESLRNEMNTRFETVETKFYSQQQQISDIKNMFYWGFGIMITLMIFMMGYMIWDRRTALNPVSEKTYSLNVRTEKLESALIALSKNDKKLAEVLRTFGIL